MATSQKLIIWGFQGVLIDSARRVVPLHGETPPATLFDDARDAVTTLSAERGHWMALVTAYEPDTCEAVLREADLDIEFEVVRCGIRDKREAYRRLLADLGRAPDEVVGIVAAVADAQALRECGVGSIVVIPRGADSTESVIDALHGTVGLTVARNLRIVLELPELQ